MSGQLRIIFMGTPDFAVHSLQALLNSSHTVVAVVTAPDRPAGRGQHLQFSPVKTEALNAGIPVLQPLNLKDSNFLEQLRSFKADLQVVVAFRMLPELVWNMPELGTFNLHASLLPQYRGAAPINHVLINGEKVTGLTTFFLAHEIDTGKIIFREEYPIFPEDNAGTLHDRLAVAGADLVRRTADAIAEGNVQGLDQSRFLKSGEILRLAPKLYKETCFINWNSSVSDIHNLIRGLSPYPAAFTRIKDQSGKTLQLKIFSSHTVQETGKGKPGEILTDSKSFLGFRGEDGILYCDEVQMEGKKRMTITEFLRGFRLNDEWSVSTDF